MPRERLLLRERPFPRERPLLRERPLFRSCVHTNMMRLYWVFLTTVTIVNEDETVSNVGVVSKRVAFSKRMTSTKEDTIA